MRKITSLLLVTISLLLGCQPKPSLDVKVLSFGADSYGYQINYKGKLFIQQEFVPAIPCKKYFSNEQQALDVGNLVMKKIQLHESPAIHVNELIEKGIDTNCVALPVK